MRNGGKRIGGHRRHLSTDRKAVQTTETEHLGADYEELRPELARLVRAWGIGSAYADDVLQEVFLTAREKCPAGLSPEDLRRWLIRVTVNRCRLEHRRNGRWRRAFEKLAHFFDRRQTAAAAESLDRDEARELVRQSLESLPAETRTLLVLRYFAELNSAEIGKIFALPEATVRGRLSAARQKLAETLRRKGYP
jgi:RNA polymerase sigma-70 factor, ECF subfamily